MQLRYAMHFFYLSVVRDSPIEVKLNPVNCVLLNSLHKKTTVTHNEHPNLNVAYDKTIVFLAFSYEQRNTSYVNYIYSCSLFSPLSNDIYFILKLLNFTKLSKLKANEVSLLRFTIITFRRI